MKVGWLVLLAGGAILLAGCSPQQRAGVEIISQPTAKVFIDGKEAGTTPYKNGFLGGKEIEVKLVTEGREWKRKVGLINNINTVIDWKIGKDENEDGGYILSMEKTGDKERSGVLVNVSPNKSAIAINGEIKGYSPIRIDDVGIGDRTIVLSYPSYKSVTIFAKTTAGYRLLIEAKLAKEGTVVVPIEVEKETLEEEKNWLMIKPTETGWLRVRENPLADSKEVARVNPGEKYEIIEEKTDWYRIEKGWISAKYAEKL